SKPGGGVGRRPGAGGDAARWPGAAAATDVAKRSRMPWRGAEARATTDRDRGRVSGAGRGSPGRSGGDLRQARSGSRHIGRGRGRRRGGASSRELAPAVAPAYLLPPADRYGSAAPDAWTGGPRRG